MAAGPSISLDATGWVCLCGDEGAVRSSPPVLHGTLADGSPFVLPLSFDGGRAEERKQSVPGQGDVEAVAVCGSAAVPSGPTLDWELTLVPQLTAVILQLRLKVIGGKAGCRLEHVTLGTTELALGSDTPPPASQDTAVPVRSGSVGAWTLLAGAASVAAAATLAPAAGVAASALAAGAYYRSRRTKGEPLAAFLINGWQSFSFSGAIPADERQPLTSLPLFSGAFHTGAAPPQLPDVPAAAPLPTHGLVSDLFAVLLSHGSGGGGGGGGGDDDDGDDDGDGGDGGGGCDGGGAACGLFLGFLTARRGVGGVSTSADAGRATLFTEQPAALRHGATVETDWAMILPIGPAPTTAAAADADAGAEAPTEDPAHLRALCCYARYMESLAAHSGVSAARAGRALAKERGTVTPVGWCSWYCHGPKVSEALMLVLALAPALALALALALIPTLALALTPTLTLTRCPSRSCSRPSPSWERRVPRGYCLSISCSSTTAGRARGATGSRHRARASPTDSSPSPPPPPPPG